MVKRYFNPLRVMELGGHRGFKSGDLPRMLFEAGISFDPNFADYGIIFSTPLRKMNVVLSEIIEGEEFVKLLGHTANDLERRRLAGSQFLEYCLLHFDRKKGGLTFAVLSKRDNETVVDLSNVLVASVRRLGEGRVSINAIPFVGSGRTRPYEPNSCFVFP